MVDPTLAMRGMVACPHALASAAGVDALRAGGSAVDAAVAAASSLAVLYPHMCSIGGDAFWLIYDAKARQVSYLDGGGRAAAAANARALRRASRDPVPRPRARRRSPRPARWRASAKRTARHGRLPFARCLQDAIHYAADGFPVTARVSRWIEQTAPELDAGTEGDFLPAARLRLLAACSQRSPQTRCAPRRARPRRLLRGRGGAEARRSSAASSPSATSRRRARTGASRSAAATAASRIYETPAPTQGFTVLEMLNLLEPLDLGPLPRPGPRPPAGAGEADRLPRPRPLACRSALRRGTDRASDLERLCRQATKPDRPQARAALGQGALLRQPDWRHRVRRGSRCRRAMPRRSSSACTASSARA